LNPTLSRLYRKLGPASLHILIHFTLNLTESVNRSDYDVLIGKVQCGGYSGKEFREKPQLGLMMEAVGAVDVVQQLPSVVGWLVNLIRGEAPMLFDLVGNACWRARSYIAGGINPLYPGTGRSNFDLTRSNYACSEVKETREIIQKLI
jgi:hypothetical protein